MVEDWLNPEPGEADDQAAGSAPPQVQHMDSQAADSASAGQLKFSKTDESYQRSGPGSPGYTRHGQRSPGTADCTSAGGGGPPRTGKRKSKEGSVPAPGPSSCSGKTTRCK